MVAAVEVFGIGKPGIAPAVGPYRSLEPYDVVGVGYMQRLQRDPVADADKRGIDAEFGKFRPQRPLWKSGVVGGKKPRVVKEFMRHRSSI
jgi:hypothetical protein